MRCDRCLLIDRKSRDCNPARRPKTSRLGVRYCEPYQTQHTFATLALMAGANPRRGVRRTLTVFL